MRLIACPYCGSGGAHMPWCRLAVGYAPPAEPKNRHATWCEVWRGQGPCDCGAG